ncbi:hypothetical protein AAVH_06014 [Aphelenchoides avenae]|nr:hypothetical protein AAVH_06014 [Aphelenchus avenae]
MHSTLVCATVFATYIAVASGYIYDGMGGRHYSFAHNLVPFRREALNSLSSRYAGNIPSLEVPVNAMGRRFQRPIVVPSSVLDKFDGPARNEYFQQEPMVEAELFPRDLDLQAAAQSASGDNSKRGMNLLKLANQAARGFGK